MRGDCAAPPTTRCRLDDCFYAVFPPSSWYRCLFLRQLQRRTRQGIALRPKCNPRQAVSSRNFIVREVIGHSGSMKVSWARQLSGWLSLYRELNQTAWVPTIMITPSHSEAGRVRKEGWTKS